MTRWDNGGSPPQKHAPPRSEKNRAGHQVGSSCPHPRIPASSFPSQAHPLARTDHNDGPKRSWPSKAAPSTPKGRRNPPSPFKKTGITRAGARPTPVHPEQHVCSRWPKSLQHSSSRHHCSQPGSRPPARTSGPLTRPHARTTPHAQRQECLCCVK